MPVKARIYLDTSVINFLHASDVPTLREVTEKLFASYIKTGFYHAFVSDVVDEEINNTLDQSKRLQLQSVIDDYHLDYADLSARNEIEKLASLYVSQKIIPATKRTDALHIAITVINHFDYLVSWNYKHMVNINREKRIMNVNQEHKYLHPLRIITPMQLLVNEV